MQHHYTQRFSFIYSKSFYNAPKLQESEEEKLRIVQVVTELIKSDIKSMGPMGEVFPTCNDIASFKKNSKFVPEPLHQFLEKQHFVKIIGIEK